jgi:hypothetical protein
LWEEKIKRGTRRREIMLKKEEDKGKLKLNPPSAGEIFFEFFREN